MTKPPQNNRWARWCRVSAGLGALFYLALLFFPLPIDIVTASIHRLLMVAPLIVVPMALSLVVEDEPGVLIKTIVGLQLPFAVGSAASLYVPAGALGVGLALPWAALTALVSVYGLWRARQRGLDLSRPEELCIDTGLLYLVIGGAWWIIARSGVHIPIFEPLIIELTPPHFHFAGFAAPVLAGLTGRLIPTEATFSRRAFGVAAFSVIAGPPLIGLGITISPLVEVICSLVLATGLLVLAVLMGLVVAPRLKSPFAWALMTISALSLVMTMVFACLYAIGEYRHEAWLHIPTMAQTHGLANVFGFSLCGLAAAMISGSRPRQDPS